MSAFNRVTLMLTVGFLACGGPGNNTGTGGGTSAAGGGATATGGGDAGGAGGATGGGTGGAGGGVANQLPTVTLTSPTGGATFTSLSDIALAATAADSDGTIARVDFYEGANLLGGAATAPYAFTWSTAAAGSYALTARATDNGGGVTTSAAVNITVADPTPKLYFIQTDQLNTPRRISDSTGVAMWTWPQGEPFGDSAPNEDVDGDSVAFVFNLRFPGQYFDAETGTSYNYFRDYDPTVGRYVQSDPIGLLGGVNAYAYSASRPTQAIDPAGLVWGLSLGTWDENLSDALTPLEWLDMGNPNVFVITSHGNSGGIYGVDPNGKRVAYESVDAVEQAIRATGKYRPGMRIVMYACSTGAGKDSLAQGLANRLRVPVTAPNGLFWSGGPGFVSNPDAYLRVPFTDMAFRLPGSDRGYRFITFRPQ